MSCVWIKGPFPGVFWTGLGLGSDFRGSGMKILDTASIREAGVDFSPVESFLVTSLPGVLRGLHGQPESDGQGKLVTCLSGAVHDVLLDLRPDSTTFRRGWAMELSESNRRAVYIPPGVLHGFCVLGYAPAVVLIQASVPHAPGPGIGVRWDSFGHCWPVAPGLISERDLSLPLAGFTAQILS